VKRVIYRCSYSYCMYDIFVFYANVENDANQISERCSSVGLQKVDLRIEKAEH